MARNSEKPDVDFQDWVASVTHNDWLGCLRTGPSTNLCMSWICYVFVFKVYLYLCFSCGSLAGMQWSVWDGEPAPYRWITHCFKPPACQYTSRLLNPSPFCVFIWKSHVAVYVCIWKFPLTSIPTCDWCGSCVSSLPMCRFSSLNTTCPYSSGLFVCLSCLCFKLPWQNTNRRNTLGLCAGVFLCVCACRRGSN